jgi:thioredoxin 1
LNSDLPKSFQALIQDSDLPVLVDFWAEWCGACRTVSPTIQQIAGEFKGKLITVKVNVDKKPHIAAQYQIQSIPTIMLFHKGNILKRFTGALPFDTLKNEIQQTI